MLYFFKTFYDSWQMKNNTKANKNRVGGQKQLLNSPTQLCLTIFSTYFYHRMLSRLTNQSLIFMRTLFCNASKTRIDRIDLNFLKLNFLSTNLLFFMNLYLVDL